MKIREPDRVEERIKQSKWYGNEEVISDVGELVRCKDCKYGKYDKINRKYQCEKIRQRTLFIIWHDGDFFCKDGEPKDGEQQWKS